MRDDERGRILRRPRGMGPDHGLVVAVSVDIFRLVRAHRETLLLLRITGRQRQGGYGAPDASWLAATVAVIIASMNRAAVSSSCAVKPAITLSMWRARCRNMAVPLP